MIRVSFKKITKIFQELTIIMLKKIRYIFIIKTNKVILKFSKNLMKIASILKMNKIIKNKINHHKFN